MFQIWNHALLLLPAVYCKALDQVNPQHEIDFVTFLSGFPVLQ